MTMPPELPPPVGFQPPKPGSPMFAKFGSPMAPLPSVMPQAPLPQAEDPNAPPPMPPPSAFGPPPAPAPREMQSFQRDVPTSVAGLPELPLTSPQPAPAQGSGGGGGPPAMSGMRQDVEDAHQQLLNDKDTQKELVKEEGAVKAENSLKASQLTDQFVAEDQKRQGEIQAFHEEKAQVYDQKMTALTQDLDELKSQRMDPNRLLNDQGTGAKLTAVAAMVMGGWLQGYKGGDNPAATILNNALDRDYKAQEGNLQNQRGVIQGKQTLLQQWKANGDSDEEMKLKFKGMGLETFKMKLQSLAQKSGSQLDLVNAQKAAAGITEEQDQLASRYKEIIAQKAEQQAAAGAASRRAEADKAFNQKLKLIELGQKGQQVASQSNKENAEADKIRAGAGASPEASGLEEERDLLKNLSGLMGPKGKDISGAGMIAGRLPDVALDDKGLQVRQAYNELRAREMKNLAARGVDPAEKKKMLDAAFPPETNEQAMRVAVQRRMTENTRKLARTKKGGGAGASGGWDKINADGDGADEGDGEGN